MIARWLTAASAAVIIAAMAAIGVAVAFRSAPVLIGASVPGIVAAIVFPVAFARATAGRRPRS